MPKEEVEAMLAHKLEVLDRYRADVAKTGDEQMMLWSEDDLSFEWCQVHFANRAWFKRRTLAHLAAVDQRFKETVGGLILLP